MTTNQHHTEYAPPVLRVPSPASSIGTSYGADQTSFSDSEYQLSQAEFEKKWEDRLELKNPRKEEEEANQDPLLFRPKTEAEEKALFDKIIHTLRQEVQQLEENELFEQTLLRGSQAALVPQPTTNDIDTLMRSMMGPGMDLGPAGRGSRPPRMDRPPMTNGPWNNYGKEPVYAGSSSPTKSTASSATVGKRSRNGRSRKA